MARTPQIPDEDYAMLLKIVEEAGYDIGGVQKVPQSVSPGAQRIDNGN
jgi:hypothetical protein